MADSQSHPFCSLLLQSEITLDTFDPTFDRPVSTLRAFFIQCDTYPMTHTLIHSLIPFYPSSPLPFYPSSLPSFFPSSFPPLFHSSLPPFLHSSLLPTLTTITTQKDSTDERDLRSIWYGPKFAQGIEPENKSRPPLVRSIYPTRTIFQGGLRTGGACRLPSGWNSCSKNTDYCYKGKKISKTVILNNYKDITGTTVNHYFDELVTKEDCKVIDASSEGVLSKLVRSDKNTRNINNKEKKLKKPIRIGDYQSKYFPLVYEALEKRGLAMALEIPETTCKSEIKPQGKWMVFTDLQSKIKAAQLCEKRTGAQVWLDPLNLDSPLSGISLQSILPVQKVTSNLNSGRRRQGSDRKESNNDNSHRSVDDKDHEYSTLPAFTHDKSDLLLASMIERESDSYNLYLATFFLSHQMIRPDESLRKIKKVRPDKDTLSAWSKAILSFPSTSYTPTGIRSDTHRYFCRIKASNTDEFYTVPGKTKIIYLFVIDGDIELPLHMLRHVYCAVLSCLFLFLLLYRLRELAFRVLPCVNHSYCPQCLVH